MSDQEDIRTFDNACAVIVGTLNEGRLIESVELEDAANDGSWKEYKILGRLPDSDIKFVVHLEMS